MNPLIRKELQHHMRDRRGWLLLSLYLLILGGVVILTYYKATVSTWSAPDATIIGLGVFLSVAFTQLGLLLVLAPVYSAGRITIEKEQRTLASLLTSLLTPAEIWWGKYVASILFLTLLLLSALPVLGFVFAFAGVGLLDVLKATGMTLVILASVCSIGLYCSSFFRRSVHATAVSYAIILVLTVLSFIVGALLEPDMMTPASYSKGPLYFNPFYALATLVYTEEGMQNEWLICLLLYAAMGLVAAALGLRNIEKSGEQT